MPASAALEKKEASVNLRRTSSRGVIERIEKLEEEKKTISDDIRDVYAEAKANGFDVKALRTINAFAQDRADRARGTGRHPGDLYARTRHARPNPCKGCEGRDGGAASAYLVARFHAEITPKTSMTGGNAGGSARREAAISS